MLFLSTISKSSVKLRFWSSKLLLSITVVFYTEIVVFPVGTVSVIWPWESYFINKAYGFSLASILLECVKITVLF
jgi:hypothetical protein